MGGTYPYNIRDKADMVAYRVRGWSSQREVDGESVIVSGKCLDYSVRGRCLWTVWETTQTRVGASEPFIVRRWIGLDLISKDSSGYGYKDMDESVHPYYYDCPLKFLDMVPEVASQDWRDGVREFHAGKKAQGKKKAAIKVGDTLKLVNTTIPEVVVVAKQGSKIQGAYQGRVYRITPRFIGEVVAA